MIQQLNTQIDRLSSLRFSTLGFPAALETRFEADTCARRSLRLASEGVIAIVLFDLFLFADHLISPSEFHQALIVRLGIITPLAVGLNWALWRKPRLRYLEIAVAVVICLTGLTHLYLERNVSAVNSAFALFGVLAVVIYANTAVRLRPTCALASSAVLVIGDLIFLQADPFLLPRQKMLGLTLTLITVTVSLISNYSSNREERLSYLLALRGTLLLKDLHHSNERLANIAETDSLTGLTNRFGFERRFETLWAQAINQPAPFSVIMVDVDHFKDVNDTHGHLYGDKVLRRIAHLVLEALRREHDFAARFGGEEFVVLLPQTDRTAAMLVAERLRSLVNLAGFPPPDDIQFPRKPFATIGATVSCGVASTFPTTMDERQQLLAAADKALYAAKDAGRNRVELANFEPRTPAAHPEPRRLPSPVIVS